MAAPISRLTTNLGTSQVLPWTFTNPRPPPHHLHRPLNHRASPINSTITILSSAHPNNHHPFILNHQTNLQLCHSISAGVTLLCFISFIEPKAQFCRRHSSLLSGVSARASCNHLLRRCKLTTPPHKSCCPAQAALKRCRKIPILTISPAPPLPYAAAKT